jgi:hypothetical protein
MLLMQDLGALLARPNPSSANIVASLDIIRIFGISLKREGLDLLIRDATPVKIFYDYSFEYEVSVARANGRSLGFNSTQLFSLITAHP